MKRAVMLLSACVLLVGGWAAREEPASSHERAVLELLDLMGLERAMMGGAVAMIDAQIQGNPAIAPYRDVMLQWAGKTFKWEAVVSDFTVIYAEAFTEPELREMIAFYKTPTGQKVLAKMPELMQKGASVGAALGQKHAAELEEMVMKRKKELDAGEEK